MSYADTHTRETEVDCIRVILKNNDDTHLNAHSMLEYVSQRLTVVEGEWWHEMVLVA